jgi:hypothetical protein
VILARTDGAASKHSSQRAKTYRSVRSDVTSHVKSWTQLTKSLSRTCSGHRCACFSYRCVYMGVPVREISIAAYVLLVGAGEFSAGARESVRRGEVRTCRGGLVGRRCGEILVRAREFPGVRVICRWCVRGFGRGVGVFASGVKIVAGGSKIFVDAARNRSVMRSPNEPGWCSTQARWPRLPQPHAQRRNRP